MELKSNKTTFTIAVLVIILIVGIGILFYNGDFGVKAPTENTASQIGSTSGQVSINILPNPNANNDEGGE